MFFGIIVRMNREDGEKHHKPHIHAWHAGKREELFANWQLLSDGEPFFKIEPLRLLWKEKFYIK